MVEYLVSLTARFLCKSFVALFRTYRSVSRAHFHFNFLRLLLALYSSTCSRFTCERDTLLYWDHLIDHHLAIGLPGMSVETNSGAIFGSVFSLSLSLLLTEDSQMDNL